MQSGVRGHLLKVHMLAITYTREPGSVMEVLVVLCFFVVCWGILYLHIHPSHVLPGFECVATS